MVQKLKFVDPKKSDFFSTVKMRVDSYFKENNISKNANGAMWGKTIFFISSLVTLYALIISNYFSPLVMLFLCVALGMCIAFIGFNVCHDAIHGSFSRNTFINKTFGLLFNVLGANAYVWSITHNIVHHTYTNVPGHDEDIEVAPGLIRLSPEEKITKIQRYQHLYAFFLYGLASITWVFKKDFKKFFQSKVGCSFSCKHPRREYFNLFFFKALYYACFIIVPFIVLDITWWQLVIGFVSLHLAEGVTLGLVFQLAHTVEGTEFPCPNDKGNIEEAWAIHQMQTTANFARTSPIANFLCGGLNMQIEHHLFPRICHIHYRSISPIVKQTAEEFNVPYIENKTFTSALGSHYRMLKKFGREAV